MNRKFEEIQAIFPFLSRLDLNADELDTLVDVRVDTDMEKWLSFAPANHYESGSLVDIRQDEVVHLVWVDDVPRHAPLRKKTEFTVCVEKDAVRRAETRISHYAHEGTTTREGETILDALPKFYNGEPTHLVIERHGFEVENHSSKPDWELIIVPIRASEEVVKADLRARIAVLQETLDLLEAE